MIPTWMEPLVTARVAGGRLAKLADLVSYIRSGLLAHTRQDTFSLDGWCPWVQRPVCGGQRPRSC
jgi:hypothetical protein